MEVYRQVIINSQLSLDDLFSNSQSALSDSDYEVSDSDTEDADDIAEIKDKQLAGRSLSNTWLKSAAGEIHPCSKMSTRVDTACSADRVDYMLGNEAHDSELPLGPRHHTWPPGIHDDTTWSEHLQYGNDSRTLGMEEWWAKSCSKRGLIDEGRACTSFRQASVVPRSATCPVESFAR